jgi:hypothetical protein
VDNTTVIQTVWEWIRQPKAFFEKGIRMIPESWEKNVLAPGGSMLKTDMSK